MKRIAYLIILCLHSIFSAAFDQIDAFPLMLNPSFAGSSSCARVIVGHHNVLPYMDGGNDSHISIDQYVEKLHGGIGTVFNFRNDIYQKRFNANLIYAPKFSFMAWDQQVTISPSVQYGFTIRDIDFLEEEQNNLSTGFTINTMSTLFGLTYNIDLISSTPAAWINETFYIEPRLRQVLNKFTMHFHQSFPFKPVNSLSFFVNGLWRFDQQDAMRNFNIGAKNKNLIGGLGISHIDWGNTTGLKRFYSFIGYRYNQYGFRLGYGRLRSGQELGTIPLDTFQSIEDYPPGNSLELKFQYSFNCKRANING